MMHPDAVREWCDEQTKELRAEVERLRAANEDLEDRLQDADSDRCSDPHQCWKEEKAKANAAESRLAAATELLRRWEANCARFDETVLPDTRTFLAAQPAAPARAEAEQALHEVPDGTLRWLRDDGMSTSLMIWATAELARREAEK